MINLISRLLSFVGSPTNLEAQNPAVQQIIVIGYHKANHFILILLFMFNICMFMHLETPPTNGKLKDNLENPPNNDKL